MITTMKKLLLTSLFIFSANYNAIRTQNTKTIESPILTKFSEYEQETKNMVDSIVKEINLDPFYQVIMDDFEAIYSKLETILGQINENKEQNTEEKIASYKYGVVLLYQMASELSFISEKNLKALLKSFLFTLVRIANSENEKNHFLNDNNILAYIAITKAMGIELKTTAIAEKILQKVESKLEKLRNNKLDDYKYEYAYYKVIEKIVDQFFSNQNHTLLAFCDKLTLRGQIQLKKDLESNFKNKKNNKKYFNSMLND